jgi:hypothetical protein
MHDIDLMLICPDMNLFARSELAALILADINIRLDAILDSKPIVDRTIITFI